MLTRRQFIGFGAATSAVLAVSAWCVLPPFPQGGTGPGRRFLSEADAAMLMAIAPVMLGLTPPSLPDLVQHVDQAVSGLPAAVQRDVRRLFDLLAWPPGRRIVAGVAVPWHMARAGTLAGMLTRWQRSRLLPLRQAYQALHALIHAAWYGDPASWAAIGYARPAHVVALLPEEFR